MSQNNGYDIPFEILSRADSLGKLTALGKNVFMKVSIAREDAMDRWGDLTEPGFPAASAYRQKNGGEFPGDF